MKACGENHPEIFHEGEACPLCRLVLANNWTIEQLCATQRALISLVSKQPTVELMTGPGLVMTMTATNGGVNHG